MIYLFIISNLILIGLTLYFNIFQKSPSPQPQQTPTINIDLRQIEKMIEQMPNKVLQSITSSTNGMKGNVGELIGYIKLSAEYDRIIPLGDVMDFLAIRFTKKDKPGTITFIDCKTGNARLSASQKQVKELIENKQIEFVKYNIKVSNGETEG